MKKHDFAPITRALIHLMALLIFIVNSTHASADSSWASAPVGPIADFREINTVVVSDHLIGHTEGKKLIDTLLSLKVAVWLVHDQQTSIVDEDPSAPFSQKYLREMSELTANPLVKRLDLKAYSLYWPRDWMPVPVMSEKMQTEYVSFLHHTTSDMTEILLQKLRNGEESYSLAPFFDLITQGNYVSSTAPIVFEGGNLLTDGRGNCFSSDRLYKMNYPATTDVEKITNKVEILAAIKSRLVCRTFHVFSAMPYDADNHVDIWLQFTNETTAIVPKIFSQTFGLISTTNPRDEWKLIMNRAVSQYLDARASDLRALGYKVLRIPLPLKDDGRITKTYINNILVNGTVILPRYANTSHFESRADGYVPEKYLDDSLLSSYEKGVEKTYQHQGFKVKWVEADDFIGNGGAFHCLTRGIFGPAASPRPLP